MFFVLILLYFVITFAIVLSFYPFLNFLDKETMPGIRYLLTIAVLALIVGSIHFYLSALTAVRYIKDNLGALKPDPEDSIHKQLLNIMREIHVVTGNKIKMECLVIPTLSMNALSAVDLKGNTIIIITEGLLSRISRPQLEAVMAHEAHHILSGDCMESTIAASLFGIPSAALEKMLAVSRGRLFLFPGFIFAWILVKLSYFLNMFISREREYRADAGAVRMTRNPLALAEVLHLLSRNWRGTGFIGRGLEMLCIVGPSVSRLDESEGWFPNLMSTHPPLRKRIKVLLKMAHAGMNELRLKKEPDIRQKKHEASGSLFYALDNKNLWQGPYSLLELAVLPWLSTLTWVSQNGEEIEKASNIPVINTIFKKRLASENTAISAYMCPSCRNHLLKRHYEKTTIYQCKFCGGSLVENAKIPRIIVRKGTKYSDRIRALSRITMKEGQLKNITRKTQKTNRKHITLIHCPRCKRRMSRTFYSMAYLIELDRCSYCGVTWFDYDELEMLQCMIDYKMASAPAEH